MKNFISEKISKRLRSADGLYRESTALIFLFLSIFSFLSIWTFHPSDPGVFSSPTSSALNACGKVGAILSDFLIKTFGMGSFGAVLCLFAIGILVFTSKTKSKFGIHLGMTLVGTFFAAALLSLIQSNIDFNGANILMGGSVGEWISQKMKATFNTTGSMVLITGIFTLAIVSITGLRVSDLLKRIHHYCLWFMEKSWIGIKKSASLLLALIALSWEKGLIPIATLIKEQSSKQWQKIKSIEFKKPNLKKETSVKIELPVENEWSEENIEEEFEEHPVQIEMPEIQAKDDSIEDEWEEEDGEEELMADSDDEWEEEEENEVPIATKANPQQKIIGEKLLENSDLKVEAPKTLTSYNRESKRKFKFNASEAQLPRIEFLRHAVRISGSLDESTIRENCAILEQTLLDFNIEGKVTYVRPGPVVTMYEFAPGRGVKISKIASLVDDLSLALSALSVRIVAPIPGKSVVGIEIPNHKRETVFMREILEQPEYTDSDATIPIAIGKTLDGSVAISDLAKMPHLLVAGATGSGKSVFINTVIMSLLYRFTPDKMRLIMVDPKQLELNFYDEIPHLLLPVVTDPKQASMALRWAVNEMERRYVLMSKVGVRNIAGFNEKLEKIGSDGMKKLIWPEGNGGPILEDVRMDLINDLKESEIETLPFIVTIIDELADLMMVASKDVEHSIQRLAQKARASGIHLILATQRPSVDVLTGTIKANFPCRIAFKVSQKVDSRTILDQMGAEKLLGQGDMLFLPPGKSEPIRQHGAFVSEDEVQKVANHWRDQGDPHYDEGIVQMASRAYADEDEDAGNFGDLGGDEVVFKKALNLVMKNRSASASMLQRRLKIGYPRAARLVEQMEDLGIVGPAEGSRPREVLKTPEEIGL